MKKKNPIVVEAHSISGGLNNPSFAQQWMLGVDLRGNERAGENYPLFFEDDIEIGGRYRDSRLGIIVTPVRVYDDKVEVHWGQSCSIEYWKEYVRRLDVF